MKSSISLSFLIAFIALASAIFAEDVDLSKLPPAAVTFDFASEIQPILENSCVSCHGEEKQKGEYRLDTRDALIKGGETGEPAVIVGDSSKSPLIYFVARLVEDFEMPPKKDKALKPEQIALLRKWIDEGAKWPDGLRLTAEKSADNDPEKIDSAKLASLPPPATRKIDFVADIQPIFENSCYECHGPKKQEAAFRLDHKPTALKGGDLGVAIEPGKSAESLLIHMVGGLTDETMPKKGPHLTADQIGLLRAWIDQGADWPDSASVVIKENNRDHWAFKSPVKPPVPVVAQTPAVKNPIDAFIAARLEMEGLQFSPETDPITLCRRMYLDLVGLPPSPAEVDTFVAETSIDLQTAVKNLTERLLASPHYGERWGRHWLDAARYADSDGYEKDKPRIAHFYRDWVIAAFNRDLPYDQFVIEQLAGDQLPHPTQDQLVATGFLRNSMLNEEGGVDPEQFRVEAMFDRMEAVSKSVLGLTVQCAQCHNHKFDPFSQEEYYKMFAFLNNDHESQPVVYTTKEQIERTDVLRQIAETEKMLRSSPDWESRMARWEVDLKAAPQPEWTVIQPVVDKNSTDGQRFLPQADGAFLCAGYQPNKNETSMHITTPVKNIVAFRLEALTDPNLPGQGPGRSYLGTFGITEFKVDLQPTGDAKNSTPLKFVSATANLGPPEETQVRPEFNERTPVRRVIGPANYAIDNKDDSAWSNDVGPGRRNRDCAAIFTLDQPLANESGEAKLLIRLSQKHGGWNSDDLQSNAIGRFRISIATAPPSKLDSLPKQVREALAIDCDRRSEAQTATIFAHWCGTQSEWKDANAKVAELWKKHPEGTTQMTLSQREEVRPTFMFKRGDWLKPGNKVTPGVLSILNPLPENAPQTRLTLAKWLVDPKAPTTARVAVNRIWQSYFGTGLVASPDDIGTQAEAPSHPELLDWLAVEFMERGWSVKEMHRLIVSSATYQQSSRIEPGLYAKDQYNRLLARGPRFRVEGEIVRDISLSVSGLLNPKVGGKSIMPPAPAFLFLPPVSYSPFPWVDEIGEDRYRRAVYTYRRRTSSHPTMQAFDVPEGTVSCVRRMRSNTPLQALVALNETVSMEAAQALARRTLAEGGATEESRIDYVFRRCVSRVPTATERDELLGLLKSQLARFDEPNAKPEDLILTKAQRFDTLPPLTDVRQLAAYTLVSRVILNLDETITKE